MGPVTSESGRAGRAGRDSLRQSFDGVAGSYHRARPDYPAELFDDLLAVTALPPGARLLEVGCATGKATLPLARRGFRVTCVELGADLAAAARANLAGLDGLDELDVEVLDGSFEDWHPRPGEKFDLVYAATAWPWLDPAVRFRRVWEALRPGGYLAIWGAEHVFPEDGDPFFREIQGVYDEIGEGLGPRGYWPRPGELPDRAGEIAASGLFDLVHVRHFDWERRYTAEEYIDLLNTFSGHIVMADWQQERLYGEIRQRLSRRPDRSVRRHWGAVLSIAHRR